MKKFLKVLGGFIAFIFCIVILIIHLGTHLLFATNQIVSEKTINKIVDKTNISLILEDEDGNQNKLSESIYNLMKDIGFKEEQVNKIADSQGFKNILKGILNGAIKSIVYNQKDTIITTEEVETLINNNIDNIIAESGVTFDAKERTELIKNINNSINELVKDIPTTTKIYEDNPSLKEMQILFERNTKIKVIASLVIVTLLIALFKWSIGKCLRDSGIVTTIAAVLILLVGVLVAFVSSYILNGIPDFINYVSFMKPILKIIGMIFIINGGIALVAGIIQIIIGSAINKRKERIIEKGTILAE